MRRCVGILAFLRVVILATLVPLAAPVSAQLNLPLPGGSLALSVSIDPGFSRRCSSPPLRTSPSKRDSQTAAFSGGTAATSNIAGDTSTLTFTGTAVSWIGLRCSSCGIATVSIDGVGHGEIDTAAAPGSPGLASETVFTATGLAAGTHTLVITVTSRTTSGSAHIAVDAFDVTP
jgi:hypothetical protein